MIRALNLEGVRLHLALNCNLCDAGVGNQGGIHCEPENNGFVFSLSLLSSSSAAPQVNSKHVFHPRALNDCQTVFWMMWTTTAATRSLENPLMSWRLTVVLRCELDEVLQKFLK